MPNLPDLCARLGISEPIIQAPMAGGPTTPALVGAVSAAGGLGSFGSAYVEPEAIIAAAAATRVLTDRPFAINLFLHPEVETDPATLANAIEAFGSCREEAGLARVPNLAPRISLDRQFEAVLGCHPRVFSSTFGPPTPDMIAACRARDMLVVATATTPAEGRHLEALGVDAIVAQGAEAGGHRGTFLHRFDEAMIGVLPLVSMLSAELSVPIIAAGGIMDGRAIAAALAAGAGAVQMGTAFLLCPEAGTHPTHRRMMTEARDRPTICTDVYTGRPARGIRNGWIDRFGHLAGHMPPFDVTGRITGDLRRAAAERDDGEGFHLWAGQAFPMARALPAGELIAALMAEARAAASSSDAAFHR